MKNKKSIIIILLVLCIGLAGLTIAYFSNSTTLDNLFSTKEYATTYTEEFVSPDNWLPGDTTDKTVIATNTGQVDQAVRISLSEEWKSNNGDTLSGLIDSNGLLTDEEENSEKAAIINFSDNNDWTYDNGYYYYNYKLAPNESTSSLIDSVTFNPKVTLGDTCIENETESGKIITCNSGSNDYDNATYKLTINVETVQYNKYASAWNTNVEIAETKQRMLKGLKVNVADATFDNGDKTAMFEFSHPATEQTPALTDYRYIGHMPNNYVKFNCDNDGTNCEIWRIIGVFSVDDGEGNWEQRIKLVRGSVISYNTVWDDRGSIYTGAPYRTGINDWNGAKINILLNNDYLTRQGVASTNGLKELANNQIADAKYYLGGKSGNLGTTNDIYRWERGREVYNQDEYERSIFWIGKVGLMYPSDYGYTYSKGVEDDCFSVLTDCRYLEQTPSGGGVNNHPETGWIYNSTKLEGQNNICPNIFLFHNSSDSELEYLSFHDGTVGTWMVYDMGHVRPTVYLKPSIQITGGEGTEQNPYTLSS